jgi:hypothetical protein
VLLRYLLKRCGVRYNLFGARLKYPKSGKATLSWRDSHLFCLHSRSVCSGLLLSSFVLLANVP